MLENRRHQRAREEHYKQSNYHLPCNITIDDAEHSKKILTEAKEIGYTTTGKRSIDTSYNYEQINIGFKGISFCSNSCCNCEFENKKCWANTRNYCNSTEILPSIDILLKEHYELCKKSS
jgi:hypothetical protein